MVIKHKIESITSAYIFMECERRANRWASTKRHNPQTESTASHCLDESRVGRLMEEK